MKTENRVGSAIYSILNARNIVFIAMLAVGLLCIIMSGRNTASYLLLTGMERTIALMTGIALIIFSSTSFTSAQFFLEHKGAAKLFSIFFVVVGITVITFSIFSTLSLNYSKFIDSEAVQADIADRIEKRRSEIIAEYQLSQEKDEGMDINQWTMQNIDRLLTLAEQQGASWNASMRTVMETAQGMTTAEQIQQQSLDDILSNIYIETIPKTFFGFMLTLHTLDAKYFFDFFMIAIPAVFYDLIAPLAITVVLFILGYKKKREPETEAVTERNELVSPPPLKPPEVRPNIKDLTTYIENAMQEEYQILPDDAVPNITTDRCAELRKYLSSFIYKDNPLIAETNGQYISIFDKANLIKFITLQNNVQRKEV